jgi:glycosyltransferase involved in cell wall biosynthesis
VAEVQTIYLQRGVVNGPTQQVYADVAMADLDTNRIKPLKLPPSLTQVAHAPLVSVIIPTYNCAPYLSEAIDSVLLQAGVNMEVIVVDDGSTDNTKEVVETYGHHITYISQDHRRGAAAARNVGLQHASGEWIAFQDADDIWLPEKLSTQLAALQRYPDARLVCSDVLAFCDREVVRDSLCSQMLKEWCQRNTTEIPDLYYGDVYRELMFRNCVCTITVVAHRNLINEVGMFDETLKIGEDYDLWLKLTRNHPVVYIDRIFSKYRLRDAGLSGSQQMRSLRWLESHTLVREKHLRSNWIPPQYQDAVCERLSENCWELGWNCFSEERYTEARAYFLKGLSYRPLDFRTWLYWISSFLPSRIIGEIRSIKRALQIRQKLAPTFLK